MLLFHKSSYETFIEDPHNFSVFQSLSLERAYAIIFNNSCINF